MARLKSGTRKQNKQETFGAKVGKTKLETKAPGLQVGSAPHKQGNPSGMTDDELEYRTMLQEAIRWVTQQVMTERREEIIKRAEDRVKTLRELRGA